VIHLVRVIEAVAGKIPAASLSKLCQHAHEVAGKEVLRAVGFAISKADSIDDVLIGSSGCDMSVNRSRSPSL
jgi:hypothetical protein